MTRHPLASVLPQASLYGDLMQIDQIAFYAPTEKDELLIKELWGLADANWVEDEVVAIGRVHGRVGMQNNRAKLLFNYDMGIELEILRYLAGPNYVHRLGREKMVHLCHIGMHMHPGKELSTGFQTMAFKAHVLQRVYTIHHTNPFLRETGRRYTYTIYNTTPLLGTCLKVIERKHNSLHDTETPNEDA